MMKLIRLAMIVVPIVRQLLKLRQQYRTTTTNTHTR